MEFENYQSLIDDTEKCGNDDTLERFEVRSTKSEHRKRTNSDKYIHRKKYFVVDNKKCEILHESRWDIPHDHNSDGVRDYCFGIIRGLKMDRNS